MISDYRQVGYANTFIRPPVEVHGQAPIYSLDGADVVYTHSFGQVDINAQTFYGRTDFDLSGRLVC